MNIDWYLTGGDSKTLMFVQISPNEKDNSETLCSLNFASRVRGIELGPAKKQLDNTELLKYKQMVSLTSPYMCDRIIQVLICVVIILFIRLKNGNKI